MYVDYEDMKKDFTEARPWGGYKILDEGPGYKVKRLFVLPGQKLSLQLHHHRNEHWIGVCGASKLTIGEETVILEPGKNVFIPMYTKHRIENPGKIPAVLIEVQAGEYLEEDDIVRFEDIYGRSESKTRIE